MSSHVLKLFGITDPKTAILQHFGCAGAGAKPSRASTENSAKARNQAARPFDHK